MGVFGASFEVFRNSLQRLGKTLLNSGMINESTIEGLKVSKQGKVVIVWMDAITKLLFFIKKNVTMLFVKHEHAV